MVQLGFLELIIIAMISLVSLAIPTATFVIGVLIYRRLTRIEHMLNQREELSCALPHGERPKDTPR